MNRYYLFFIAGTVLSAFGQVLLKTGADRTGSRNIILSMLNFRTIAGYGLIFTSLVTSTYAMTVLPFKTAVAVLPLAYILVPLFSHLLLHEKISAQTACGGAIILAGIVIFNL